METSSQRLPRLRPLVGGKVNVDLIDRNWADILRGAATMAAGTFGRPFRPDWGYD